MNIKAATRRIAAKHDTTELSDLLWSAAYSTDESSAPRELRDELNAADVSDEDVDDCINELMGEDS